jgi:hypothetical protein
LDRGVTPGSTTPERAALGFHLAGCAACRAYRTTLEQDLLANLLLEADRPRPAPRPAPAATPTSKRAFEPAPPSRDWRRLAGQAFWYAGMSTLALIALVAIGLVGWVGIMGFSIHRNVQAMVIPTEAPTAAPTAAPTSAEPTTSVQLARSWWLW